ncbi:site-2 protease family protein [Paenibacillus thermoaerophilus]|nr:site-2 protease family protein [Paenibacillus thermoaerophilus]
MNGLNNVFAFPFEELPFVFIVLALAFAVHEFAHAYAAYKFGDDTAYRDGRVTLNPRKHIDIAGMILFLLFGFGWAKPVPVHRGKLREPRRLTGAVVSFVGPLSNLILAFVGVVALFALGSSGLLSNASSGVVDALGVLFEHWILINVFLFIFNLLPLPPLDGYRIVQDLVSPGLRAKMTQYEQWGILIFLIIAFIPPLRRLVFGNLGVLQFEIVRWMESFVAPMFGQ